MQILSCGAALVVVASLSAIQSASAQSLPTESTGVLNKPIEQIPIRVNVDSGRVKSRKISGQSPDLVFQTEINVSGASWLRLQFDEAQLSGDSKLGDDAFLWITSLTDGAVQVLNKSDLEKWGYTSAYFNGDRVRVELFAYPNTGDNRLKIDLVMAGQASDVTPFSLCGADDRVLSSDPRSARVLPAQCTGFLIDDQTHNFLTAGHCSGGLSVVQFNVPMSTEGGVLVNPPPEDQYPVDPASIQFQFVGIGQDWSYFGVFANSNTGLTPFQAMGSSYQLASMAPPVNGQSIRITGYGTDTTPATSNEVQQTSDGPYISESGTIIRYQVDTTGGNSGSPVEDLSTGLCIGIHTNAGCTLSGTGANQGTAIQNANLQNALSNPIGVAAAPDCNNNGVPDDVDLAQGAADCNNNGVLDSCEFLGIAGDLDGNNLVDGADLAMLLIQWGANGGPADLNNDGAVDGSDLALLLINWGSLCS